MRPRQFESVCRLHGEELGFAVGLGEFHVTEFTGSHTAFNGKAFCGDQKGMDEVDIRISQAKWFQRKVY